MNSAQKIIIHSNSKLIQELDLDTPEGLNYAKALIREMHSIILTSATNTMFTPCSNSIVEYNVDYNCPERARFLDLVDSSV